MSSAGLEVLGFVLCVCGTLGCVVTCVLPMWKVSVFDGGTILVALNYMDGLWMDCVVQSTGQIQCKIYDSLLALPQDLQAARALTVLAIVCSVSGLSLGIAGAQWTNCIEEERFKRKVMMVTGCVVLIAALLVLIPVSWSANAIVKDFYNPLVPQSQKRELGTCLYVGWTSSALLVFAGALLCSSCPQKPTHYTPRLTYSIPRPSQTNSAYNRWDYV
uniref:Claudin n=1 Tax=Callorhinchus milii TaxID=7868 RepID=V9L7T3_CALMI